MQLLACKHLRGIIDFGSRPRYECDIHRSCFLPQCESCKDYEKTNRLVIEPIKEVEYSQAFRDELSCIYRGDKVDSVLCRSCSNRKVIAPVYECRIHEKCTLTDTQSAEKFSVCHFCQERESDSRCIQ